MTINLKELSIVHLVILYITGVPGGRDERYTQYIPSVISVIWVNRYTREDREVCSGGAVHATCIIDIGDLHKLQLQYNPDSNHQIFFHNKFFLERDRVVIDCAEQELLRRNKKEEYRDSNAI